MSRSDYKNIYEGYLDNTGYNNRRVAERYGGCGSEPMPYEMNENYGSELMPYEMNEKYGGCGSEPTPYMMNEGYAQTSTQQAQVEIKTIYTQVLNYVNKFRKHATAYYLSGAKYYDGMNPAQTDYPNYSQYVYYEDVTATNKNCDLRNTVRSRYWMPPPNAVKSEICCKDNITFWGNCNFDAPWKANLDLSLSLFRFKVDVLKNTINAKYPSVNQNLLKFPTENFDQDISIL
jgi:hypothetical protein